MDSWFILRFLFSKGQKAVATRRQIDRWVCIFEMRGDICVSVYGWKGLGKALPTTVEKIFQKKGLELALILLMSTEKKQVPG